MMKIVAISGSTRKNSTNELILRHIAEAYQDRISVEIFNRIDTLPHFNPDLDRGHPPPAIKEFRDKIQASDGVIICTPEYVFSLPGSLKNAIEWNVSTTIFSNKPVALIVASASGEKAFEALDLLMTTIESRIADNSKILIKGAKGKVGKDGRIEDEATRGRIDGLVESLIRSIKEKNGVPTKYNRD